MILIKIKYQFHSQLIMIRFCQNTTAIQEGNRELQNSLAESECEEAIIQDKKEFGRVRNSMINVLRIKHDDEIANIASSRINKRITGRYLNQKSDHQAKRNNFFTV